MREKVLSVNESGIELFMNIIEREVIKYYIITSELGWSVRIRNRVSFGGRTERTVGECKLDTGSTCRTVRGRDRYTFLQIEGRK